MQRPRFGLSLPCELIRIKDADTVVVSILRGRFRPAIRLIGADAPESDTQEGMAATAFAEELLGNCTALSLYIPATRHLENLLTNLTFERLPGYIFLDEYHTYSDALVQAGHAVRTP